MQNKTSATSSMTVSNRCKASQQTSCVVEAMPSTKMRQRSSAMPSMKSSNMCKVGQETYRRTLRLLVWQHGKSSGMKTRLDVSPELIFPKRLRQASKFFFYILSTYVGARVLQVPPDGSTLYRCLHTNELADLKGASELLVVLYRISIDDKIYFTPFRCSCPCSEAVPVSLRECSQRVFYTWDAHYMDMAE